MKNPRIRAQHRRLNQEANGEKPRNVSERVVSATEEKVSASPQPPSKSFPGHVVRAGARLLRKKP